AATSLTGSGTVSISLSAGSGTITASGGTLDLSGSVSGRPLAIASGSASGLKVDGTAGSGGVSISRANETLELGASGSRTVSAAEGMTNGTMRVDGGTLTDSSGVTIGSGATLTGTGTAGVITLAGGTVTQSGGTLTLTSITGSGTVNGVTGAGTITASGGTLDLTGTISGATLAIASGSASVLKIDGTASSGAISISSAHQTLEIGATGSLTLSAAQSIPNGTIRLDGGTLTDSSGVTIVSGATLTRTGPAGPTRRSSDPVTQSGGTLTLTSITGSGTVNGVTGAGTITA